MQKLTLMPAPEKRKREINATMMLKIVVWSSSDTLGTFSAPIGRVVNFTRDDPDNANAVLGGNRMREELF
jgi:hypothetical protein